MQKFKVSVLGGLALFIGTGAAHAANSTIYDSDGFEASAGFTTTSGYTSTGVPGGPSLYAQSAADPPAWSVGTTVANAAGASFAAVEGSTVYAGSQAVSFTRLLSNNDTYYAPQLTGYTSLTYNQHLVDISWAMNMAAGATLDPFFGIFAFNGNDSLVYAGVDGTTGNVEYSDGAGGLVSSGTNVVLGTWNGFDLQLNYQTQTQSLFVDNQLVESGPFASSGALESGITDADIASFATDANQTGTGTAYFDNYLITSVPEPTSISLLVGASAWALGRRSKRTQIIA